MFDLSTLFQGDRPVPVILDGDPGHDDAIAWVLLYRTPLGLNIRSVGENPNAASSVGVSVLKVKYIAIGFSGLMAGFGGAFMGTINKTNCIVIFINQLREKIGVMYGNPEVTTGGRALKFYSSMRIDVRKIEQLKGAGSEFIGSRTRAKIVKNKVAPPFKSAEFDIMYGEGISKVGEILDMAVQYDIVHKGGSWFSYGDRRLGQGRDNVKEIIKNEPELAAELEQKIKDKIAEDIEKAKEERVAKANASKPAPKPEKKITREEALAKINIMVEDDED